MKALGTPYKCVTTPYLQSTWGNLYYTYMARIAVLLEIRLCVGHVTTPIKCAILVILECLRLESLWRIGIKIARLHIRVRALLGSIIQLTCVGQLCNTAMLRTHKAARIGSLL